MPSLRSCSLLLPLAWRAAVLYLVVRPLVAAASRVAEGQGGSPDSPLGIVLLLTVLGVMDTRRRGEVLFWGNLGFSPVVTAGVYTLVALVVEVLWLRIR